MLVLGCRRPARSCLAPSTLGPRPPVARLATQATPGAGRTPLRLTIIAAPGAGKGTQAAKIEADYGLRQISTGDLLREELRKQTEVGRKAEAQMKSGGLVDDGVVLGLVRAALGTPAARRSGWLLDGFPRTLAQARLLDALLAAERQPLTACLFLDVPAEVLVQRLSARLVHPASGRVYNLEYKPPREPGRDDLTGEPLVRRPDDEPATVAARLRTFDEKTAPLLAHYRAQGLLHAIASPSSDVGYVAIRALLARLAARPPPAT